MEAARPVLLVLRNSLGRQGWFVLSVDLPSEPHEQGQPQGRLGGEHDVDRSRGPDPRGPVPPC
jgi:hypothetical protein